MRRFCAGLILAGLVAGPAAAQVSRAERIQHDEILAQAGGAYRGPQAEYVAAVGERVARAAGLGDGCEFVVVDSQVVNAFTAPPGCHVYLTRGLLAVMNSEAELAAVLGHELGHVAARHAARQRSQEVVTGLAAALVGAVAKSDVVGGIAQRAAKLSNLGYSRGQEHEADTLSLRYLAAAGYPARGLADVLAGLQREDAYSARTTGRDPRTIPVWASTHPLTTDRIRRVQQQVLLGEVVRSDVGAATYLAALDGLTYGESPDQGIVAGRTFTHPRLRIAFDAPPGFRLTDQPQGVRIDGPEGMRGEFAGGRASAERLEDYAVQVLGAVASGTPLRVGQASRTTVNGVDAVVLPARASTRAGPVEVVVAAYAVGDGRAYHFATIAPVGRAQVFEPMYGSFRRLDERAPALLGPKRIRTITVGREDTIESLSQRMAGQDPLGRFLMLNALAPGQPLAPGRQVKIVTAGAP